MSKAPSENDDEIKIPLIWRLRAWWHGYDMEDVKAKLAGTDGVLSEDAAQPAKKPQESVSEQPKSEESQSDNDDSAVDEDVDEDSDSSENGHVAVKAVWDTERAHVAQVFWGDGFCGPGGPENIISMTASLNINSKRTTMVIGAGLGGPVRAIQKEYDTPVDGFETAEKLAAAGMNMSLEAGVAQDAPIIHLDLENVTEFARSYDRAYAKESMFIISNKPQLIQTIFDSLKKDGLFLLTDYILSEDADQDSASFKKWCKLEPYEPKPVISSTMESYLEDAGFSMKDNEDITDFYLNLISDARSHANKVINAMESDNVKDVTILKYMHNEAVFWDTRANLLRDGDLKVIRYLGLKSS